MRVAQSHDQEMVALPWVGRGRALLFWFVLLRLLGFFFVAVVSFAHRTPLFFNGTLFGEDVFLFLSTDTGRLGLLLGFLFLVRFGGFVAHRVAFGGGGWLGWKGLVDLS